MHARNRVRAASSGRRDNGHWCGVSPLLNRQRYRRVIDTLDLINAGGVVTFVTAWLDREAKSKNWQQRDFLSRQGNLFA